MAHGSSHKKESGNNRGEWLLTAKDVAERFMVSEKSVHKLVRDGKLGCVQITSRERRFTEEQVREFIERQSQPARVDRRASKPLSSPPKKGGEKSTGDSRISLRKEISQWL